MSNNWMFRPLTATDAERFRRWARENYTPGEPVSSSWHPEVRAECERMNAESLHEAAKSA